MYELTDLARFALSEFERGLEGLTDEEARRPMEKADGTTMNSISWTAGHLSWHWHLVQRRATGAAMPDALRGFANGTKEPSPPPSLDETYALLARAREAQTWIGAADEAVLSTADPERPNAEDIGTQLLRVILHTWFHTGEVNAIRQMLGHAEIPFVGPMLGQLQWKPAAEAGADA